MTIFKHHQKRAACLLTSAALLIYITDLHFLALGLALAGLVSFGQAVRRKDSIKN